MCGIAGYHSTKCYDDKLMASIEAMSYRGPDASDHKTVRINERFLGLGHVRLKVIDLDDRSSQPFVTQSGRTVIIFNGEIYNFLALRKLLPDQRWRTSSDTEVIAELLERYDDHIIERFNGIFAIAKLCLDTGNLSLFRDPLGVKPLYYSYQNNALFFASEIKSLTAFPVSTKISHADLLESINFGYVHEPHTGFEYINKVPPGGILTYYDDSSSGYTLSGESFLYKPEYQSFSDDIICQALKRQTVADVPLGTFFSGGADSTVIASQVDSDLLYINNNLKDSECPEQVYAKELATTLKRNLLISNFPAEDNVKKIIDIVDTVVEGVEEPISDLTYMASQQLAALAKERGFTVMLSGMGADELFGGYLRYYIIKYRFFFNPLFKLYLLLSKVKKSNSQHKFDRIRNYLSESSPLKKYARLASYFSSEEIKTCFGEQTHSKLDKTVFDRLDAIKPQKIRNNDFLSMRFLEIKGFLSHNLTVADKSSMRESVELRVPFLDLEIFSQWFGCEGDSTGARMLGKKPLLRLINQFVKFKWSPFSKTGFNPPIDHFFEKIDKLAVEELIFNKEILVYFDNKGLKDVVNKCFDGEKINYHKIWQLIFIARWLRRWGQSSH